MRNLLNLCSLHGELELTPRRKCDEEYMWVFLRKGETGCFEETFIEKENIKVNLIMFHFQIRAVCVIGIVEQYEIRKYETLTGLFTEDYYILAEKLMCRILDKESHYPVRK